jgi:hypothetical protein
MKDCKILRLERSGYAKGIVNYVDKMLDQTSYSNRKIAKLTSGTFKVPISREAVKAYRLFRNNCGNTENIEKPNQKNQYYVRSGKYRNTLKTYL